MEKYISRSLDDFKQRIEVLADRLIECAGFGHFTNGDGSSVGQVTGRVYSQDDRELRRYAGLPLTGAAVITATLGSYLRYKTGN